MADDGGIMIDRGRHNLLGVMVDAVDYESVVTKIVAAADARRPLAVSALAVHGVMTGALDPEHRFRLNALDLVVPDGQPVRWALNRLYGTSLASRVYGPALMLKTCGRAAAEGLPVFLFGGTEEILTRLRARLVERFPQLQIAGCQASRFRRFTHHERAQTVATINASGAAITFVGLGCPRQEICAYDLRDQLSMPIVAVGAAFPFHAGLLRQAPGWMQSCGLEWLYRLCSEPNRLWRRYLLLNPLFVAMILAQAARVRAFDPGHPPPSPQEILYG